MTLRDAQDCCWPVVCNSEQNRKTEKLLSSVSGGRWKGGKTLVHLFLTERVATGGQESVNYTPLFHQKSDMHCFRNAFPSVYVLRDGWC
jgi:hypothetical protein